MSNIIWWRENLKQNRHLVRSNAGPSYVVIVSGTEADREYWEKRFALTKSEIFRSDNSTRVLSVHESIPKGNCLGTLNAWQTLDATLREVGEGHPNDVILVSMMFGKGTRLSPFTQALGNCKPRFPTPYKSSSNNLYLSIGELSNLYSNLLISHLRKSGFWGLVVKWGDEVVIPGTRWDEKVCDYSDADAIRFVWFIEKPTDELAREKDWVLADPYTDSMTFQLARQKNIATLLERVESKQVSQESRLGVNLGSLAISYDFLSIMLDVFSEDLFDPCRSIDWDPYVWVALACENQREWQEEVEYESKLGNSNLVELESQYPDFFDKITRAKDLIEKRKGSPLSVKVLDFGSVFWNDFGQHIALRRNLGVLTDDTDRGSLTRDLFGLPQEQDQRGNIIINSEIHPEAQIRNSLIIDSVITAADTVIDRGIIVKSDHDIVRMPYGGIALFCTARELTFNGPNAIAFHSIAPTISLPEGGRHSTLVSPNGDYQLFSNEAITDYKGDNYFNPVLDNVISFVEASALVDGVNPEILASLGDKARNRILKEISRKRKWQESPR